MFYPTDVRGWCNSEEAQCLHKHAMGAMVLELGALCGLSTIVMAQAARWVLSVDAHKGDKHTGPQDSLEELLGNLASYNVKKKVSLFVGDFSDFGRLAINNVFDMVYVDGAHDVWSVERDITIAIGAVKNDGLIAMHDCDQLDVKRACHVLTDVGWEIVDSVGTVNVFKAHIIRQRRAGFSRPFHSGT